MVVFLRLEVDRLFGDQDLGLFEQREETIT